MMKLNIDKQSNLYIFLYSSAMVIIVAALLATAATLLRPAQQKNIETEKRLDILRSVGAATGVEQSQNKHEYVGNVFSRIVVRQLVVNIRGEYVTGVDAFSLDLRAELAKPEGERNLPVYVAQLDDSSLKYIIPLSGRGLWGPIWGYIALNDDFNTIFGASFAHRSETPGLGAEIALVSFHEQFKGKQIFRNGELVSIALVKGGAQPKDPHGVDAVSGGTITSQGLEDMLLSNLKGYKAFFAKQKEKDEVKLGNVDLVN